MDVAIGIYLTLLTIWWAVETFNTYVKTFCKPALAGSKFRVRVIGLILAAIMNFISVAVIGVAVGLTLIVIYEGWLWLIS